MRTDLSIDDQPDSDNQKQLEAVAILEQMAGLAILQNIKVPEKLGDSAAGENAGPRRKSWQPDLRYRSLVERLPVVTFMASLDDTLQELYISPQIEALLGFTQDEWLDNPLLWFRQLHPDDRERWIAEFAQTCAVGAHFRAEYRLIARDGHIVWVQGECQIIRDDAGNPAFLQGIAFDITHLKQAAQIEEAKLAAEAANRAKSEFLARMSHEIRTPLNGVVGMIDLLRTTEMTAAQQRYAELAKEAADGLLGVINDILDFSKIEAGKVEIESIEFDFHKLLEDLTELFAPLAAKKKIILASVLGSDLPRLVIGDPSRIRQVLTNLVNNALKFTDHGYVCMRATQIACEKDAFSVRVEVEDTGIGIPADRKDRLFKSFSQVDMSTTRKFGGTGLGLVISKRLVELMGGEIGIESEEGHGTTFWFTLRFGKVKMPAATAESPADSLLNVRVLGVEANPTYRRLLSEQLEDRVSPTTMTIGPDEALDVLQRAHADGNPFAVALLPYRRSEAPSLISMIRGDSRLRGTKLIAVLDIDDRTDPAVISREGFVCGIHRPLVQSRLLEAIASVMAQRVEPVTTARSAPKPVQDLIKGLHVLVAEDNEMNQFVTEQTLARAGCTCDIVADGALAVKALETGRYDVVLMDCQMPGMDGLEASRKIREREATRAAGRMPIIALTAEAISGDREKCLAAGMDGYVTKPINADELYGAIQSLARRALPAAPQASLKASPPSPAEVPTTTVPPSPHSPPEQPIDVQALLTRCMHDATFAMRTLEKFQKRALDDVELLRREVESGDVANLTRLAHNLKAVAAHVSATSLRAVAFEIEQAGARKDLQLIDQQLARLAEEAQRCSRYVPDAMQQLARQVASTEKKT